MSVGAYVTLWVLGFMISFAPLIWGFIKFVNLNEQSARRRRVLVAIKNNSYLPKESIIKNSLDNIIAVPVRKDAFPATVFTDGKRKLYVMKQKTK